MDHALFGSDLWKPVLDKYSAVTGLSVELFDVDGRVALASDQPTPVYALFREYDFETGMFSDCARQCLSQTDSRPVVVVAELHGLTVIGASLILNGAIVGAAVAGYAISKFSQVPAVQRWAQSTKVPFDRLWEITRRQQPMPGRRLRLHGELLQVLGDALLRENLRTRQYEKVAKQLKAADAAKDDFLAVLSHELRSPLVPILGWAHLLKKQEGSELVRKGAEVIERNAQAQSRMIEDLLDINLITHGSVRLVLENNDLASLIRAALETCAQDLEKKQISLTLVDESGPLRINGDAGRLQQIFRNILSNAVKFTPAKGCILITLSQEGNDAIVAVADNGKGIEPEFLPFVFDTFRQQEQGTRREHEGLGIGLALVKQLVELHHGMVRVKSEGGGRGTEVVLRLPLAEALSTIDHPQAPGAAAPAPLAGLSIVVVDDSDDARDFLQKLLELLGAKVATARDGREGLDIVSAAAPDVVLCDLRMPRLDGYEFLNVLLRQRGARHPPVVAMSAFVSEADRQRTREAGFHAHLAKPFDEVALVAAVNAALRRANPLAPSAIAV